MNVADLIARKRDGQTLEEPELRFLIEGYAQQSIPDYQMSALAMAIYFQGMTEAETTSFTAAMIESGQRLDWPPKPPAVDKHSTGGVGDKVSIPLAPLLACCGVAVPMISGRGLGATGGTLDKLESIPGYRADLSNDEFRSVVNFCGCSIASASASLAPADKRLYALRDVTATVPSIPLITSSILSKKIAEGIEALVLDVKWGSGAFMKTLPHARNLAEMLVRVGNRLGVKTSAVITDMNQPLGSMIGNAVEIDESIDILKGEGPADVTELTLQLGARLLHTAGTATSLDDGYQILRQKIATGEGLERLQEMVRSHGGDLNQKRRVAIGHPVLATESGTIHRIETDRLGLAVIEMGGGRKQIGDKLDHSTGIECLVRIGDPVEIGQPLATVFCEGPAKEYALQLVGAAFGVSRSSVEEPALIVETIE